MEAIYKREIRSYFLSPIAYVFIGTFMLIAGIFFSLTNILGLNTNFASTIGSVTFIFIIIVPVLTMRLFAKEKKEKTDQLLLTSGVSVQSIVLGKYFAAISVFLFTLLTSLIFPFIISFFGAAILGEVVSAYIGFCLLGFVMIAIGMFVSASTENQVVAATLTAAIMLLMWIADAALSLVSNIIIKNILLWFSLFDRLEPFILGKLSLSGVVYYLSFIIIFVYASYLKIERSRWS